MTMPGLPRRPTALRGWMLPGLVIAVLVGLMWMHALGAGHHPGAVCA